MSRKTDRNRGAKTHLSAEEHALWRNVTESIEPLEGQERRRQTAEKPAGTAPSSAESPTPASRRQQRIVAPDNLGRGQPAKSPPLVTPGKIDRRAQRKIASGRTAIDSTLDLHGMTQEQAFSRLRRHIEEASNAGQRCILVITGKGGSPGAGGGSGTGPGSGRGILRRNLPDWLANQALSGLVSAIAPAGRAHGGSGAFYVRLKKRK